MMIAKFINVLKIPELYTLNSKFYGVWILLEFKNVKKEEKKQEEKEKEEKREEKREVK